MLFCAFTAHEGLLWWQLACVEVLLFLTGATLAAWDLMEVCGGQR